ncbi:MAG: alpha/beta fold hydrolase [Spirochaetaceae bacterium]|nr:MAG: alpha/beta fold hydrolase [Spirochaetaceae bacterium]
MRILLALVALFAFASCVSQRFASGEVDELIAVEIGGMTQWIAAHGDEAHLPVLLWLHGGPGAAQMPVARAFNRNLESEFIVIHWDQRGAGKSNPRDFDDSKMTVERFVEDVHEVTRYLKQRFGRERIYLLGHSWGSQIGIAAAHRYPDDYIAYIGVSQMVDGADAQVIAEHELRRRLEDRGRARELRRLDRLDGPPYRDHGDYVTFAKMLDAMGMNMDVPMRRLAAAAIRSDLYSSGDLVRWLRGANRGSGPMWDETQALETLEFAPSVAVPCFFIMGEQDFNTPAALVDRLLDRLESPHKELIVFEGAAHTPFFADPERFLSALRRIKKTTSS